MIEWLIYTDFEEHNRSGHMEQPNYYAIIPACVRYSDIPANAKLLYGEITALANKTGVCFASNLYFANLYDVSSLSITRWIGHLKKAGFVTVKIKYRKGTKSVEARHITLTDVAVPYNTRPPIKNDTTPYQKRYDPPIKNDEVKNNTRLIIHTNKNIPDRSQVVEYVNTRDEKIDVDNFIDYYTSNGWKVGKNNMRDWKAAVRQWERRQKERNDEKRKSDNGRTPTDEWINPIEF